MENVNKQRQNFISVSELNHSPLKFSFRRVRLQLTKEVAKTERTQIHFLSDVLVAVASLDLKIPNNNNNTRYLLCSNEGVLLKHPSGKMKKSFGDRSFSVAAPTLWNALPVSLRSIKYISTFKSNLKTYLFKLAFNIC